MRLLLGALIAGCIVLATFRPAQGGAHSKPVIGDTVDDFTAKDVLGTPFSLSGVDREKFVVLAFVGVDCPLAKLYTPRLVELARKYQPQGVVFVGVDANRQDAMTQIAAYARRHAINFPILKDLRQSIADRVGVTRTPQVIVLDRARKLRYRGRIDDQFGFAPSNRAASYRKSKPERNDLQSALDSILAGAPVAVPETEVAGCLIGRDREPSARSAVTYTKDVAPILNSRCVCCHRPNQIGPFALTSYQECVGWADMIAEVTDSNRMPPWHADPKYGTFSNDARLSDEEKRVLAKWAAAGAPEGDPRDLPAPPKFAEGWTIPEPDETLYMSTRPYDVPATGVIPYKFFVLDPGWKTDRWISAIEPRPGNTAVVHHILVFVIPPNSGKPDFLRADDCYFAGYVPGNQAQQLDPGFARFVPAGSLFVFNVHYTPNGSPQQDRSYMGVKFADPQSVVREATNSCALNSSFRIPPGAANYEVRSQYVFQQDSLLLTLIPHMHYRGKDFLYELAYPDGRQETLLSVPHYDFGWQLSYRLKAPKQIPRGSVLTCVAHFDNSASNLNNPNPDAVVGWGQQTFDEMMNGYFEIAPAAEGLLHHTRWWTPVVGRLNLLVSHTPADYLLGFALTAVNIAVLAVLAFNALRSRKASARGTASSQPSASPESTRS
jgi:peroxiredoxin